MYRYIFGGLSCLVGFTVENNREPVERNGEWHAAKVVGLGSDVFLLVIRAS